MGSFQDPMRGVAADPAGECRRELSEGKQFVLGNGVAGMNSENERKGYTNRLCLSLRRHQRLLSKLESHELAMVCLYSQLGGLFDLQSVRSSLRKSFDLVKAPQGSFLELYLAPDFCGGDALFHDFTGEGIFLLSSELSKAPPLLDRNGKKPLKHEINQRWEVPLVYIISRMAYDILFRQPTPPTIQELVQKIEELVRVLPRVLLSTREAGICLFLVDLIVSNDRQPEGFTLSFLMDRLGARLFDCLRVAASACSVTRDEIHARCVERLMKSENMDDVRDACFKLFHNFCPSMYLQSLAENGNRARPVITANGDGDSLRSKIRNPSYVPLVYINYLLERDKIVGAVKLAADMEKQNILPHEDQVQAYKELVEYHVQMGTLFHGTQTSWETRHVNAFLPFAGRIGFEVLVQTLHSLPEGFTSTEHYSEEERRYIAVASHQTILSLLVNKYGDRKGVAKFASYWNEMPILSVENQIEWARDFLQQDNPIPESIHRIGGGECGIPRPDLYRLMDRQTPVVAPADALIEFGGVDDLVDGPLPAAGGPDDNDDRRVQEEEQRQQVDDIDQAIVDRETAGKDLRVGDDDMVAAEDSVPEGTATRADDYESPPRAEPVDGDDDGEYGDPMDIDEVEEQAADSSYATATEIPAPTGQPQSAAQDGSVSPLAVAESPETEQVAQSTGPMLARAEGEEEEVEEENASVHGDDGAGAQNEEASVKDAEIPMDGDRARGSDTVEAGYDAEDSQQDQDHSVVDEDDVGVAAPPVPALGVVQAPMENGDSPVSHVVPDALSQIDPGYLPDTVEGEFARPRERTRMQSGYLAAAEESQGQTEEEEEEEPVSEVPTDDDTEEPRHHQAAQLPAPRPQQNPTLSDMSAADERSELEEISEIRHDDPVSVPGPLQSFVGHGSQSLLERYASAAQEADDDSRRRTSIGQRAPVDSQAYTDATDRATAESYSQSASIDSREYEGDDFHQDSGSNVVVDHVPGDETNLMEHRRDPGGQPPAHESDVSMDRSPHREGGRAAVHEPQPDVEPSPDAPPPPVAVSTPPRRSDAEMLLGLGGAVAGRSLNIPQQQEQTEEKTAVDAEKGVPPGSEVAAGPHNDTAEVIQAHNDREGGAGDETTTATPSHHCRDEKAVDENKAPDDDGSTEEKQDSMELDIHEEQPAVGDEHGASETVEDAASVEATRDGIDVLASEAVAVDGEQKRPVPEAMEVDEDEAGVFDAEKKAVGAGDDGTDIRVEQPDVTEQTKEDGTVDVEQKSPVPEAMEVVEDETGAEKEAEGAGDDGTDIRVEQPDVTQQTNEDGTGTEADSEPTEKDEANHAQTQEDAADVEDKHKPTKKDGAGAEADIEPTQEKGAGVEADIEPAKEDGAGVEDGHEPIEEDFAGVEADIVQTKEDDAGAEADHEKPEQPTDDTSKMEEEEALNETRAGTFEAASRDASGSSTIDLDGTGTTAEARFGAGSKTTMEVNADEVPYVDSEAVGPSKTSEGSTKDDMPVDKSKTAAAVDDQEVEGEAEDENRRDDGLTGTDVHVEDPSATEQTGKEEATVEGEAVHGAQMEIETEPSGSTADDMGQMAIAAAEGSVGNSKTSEAAVESELVGTGATSSPKDAADVVATQGGNGELAAEGPTGAARVRGSEGDDMSVDKIEEAPGTENREETVDSYEVKEKGETKVSSHVEASSDPRKEEQVDVDSAVEASGRERVADMEAAHCHAQERGWTVASPGRDSKAEDAGRAMEPPEGRLGIPQRERVDSGDTQTGKEIGVSSPGGRSTTSALTATSRGSTSPSRPTRTPGSSSRKRSRQLITFNDDDESSLGDASVDSEAAEGLPDEPDEQTRLVKRQKTDAKEVSAQTSTGGEKQVPDVLSARRQRANSSGSAVSVGNRAARTGTRSSEKLPPIRETQDDGQVEVVPAPQGRTRRGPSGRPPLPPRDRRRVQDEKVSEGGAQSDGSGKHSAEDESVASAVRSRAALRSRHKEESGGEEDASTTPARRSSRSKKKDQEVTDREDSNGEDDVPAARRRRSTRPKKGKEETKSKGGEEDDDASTVSTRRSTRSKKKNQEETDKQDSDGEDDVPAARRRRSTRLKKGEEETGRKVGEEDDDASTVNTRRSSRSKRKAQDSDDGSALPTRRSTRSRKKENVGTSKEENSPPIRRSTRSRKKDEEGDDDDVSTAPTRPSTRSKKKDRDETDKEDSNAEDDAPAAPRRRSTRPKSAPKEDESVASQSSRSRSRKSVASRTSRATRSRAVHEDVESVSSRTSRSTRSKKVQKEDESVASRTGRSTRSRQGHEGDESVASRTSRSTRSASRTSLSTRSKRVHEDDEGVAPSPKKKKPADEVSIVSTRSTRKRRARESAPYYG